MNDRRETNSALKLSILSFINHGLFYVVGILLVRTGSARRNTLPFS